VAIVIGADPAAIFSAVAASSEGMDKFLLQESQEKEVSNSLKCKTVDLEVPANSEIVLKVMWTDDIRMEGPFGDHTGYSYSLNLIPHAHRL
jgi:4-hydroxy-3-polyprenylbenzoate decarboxylase